MRSCLTNESTQAVLARHAGGLVFIPASARCEGATRTAVAVSADHASLGAHPGDRRLTSNDARGDRPDERRVVAKDPPARDRRRTARLESQKQ
jgi:hypothetical protein